MKLVEFKAWFEGFTESLEGAPSAKQWKRIKEQVSAIDGVGITERVYVDRYWPGRPIGYPYWTAYSSAAGASGHSLAAVGQNSAQAQNAQYTDTFNGTTAMYAAGKAESLAS